MKLVTKKRISDNIAGWSFAMPALIFMLAFLIYPLIYTFALSFQEYNFVFDDKGIFVGLDNYKQALQDEAFLKSIRNTLYFAVIYIPVMFILGFLVGYHFSNQHLWVSKISRVVMFIPMVIPVSMSCFMFLFILNGSYGLINSILSDYLHLPMLARDWMNEMNLALNVILVVTVWQRIGFIGLLFMGGIQSISDSVIEAAIIDGASTWQRITRIIIPNLRETYLVVGMLTTITAIKLFAQVVAMTGSSSPQQAGGPAGATSTIYVETYRSAFFDFDMGLGAAMGYIMAALVVSLFAVNFFLTRTERA